MVLPDNIEAVRTRLASRTSFFGGSISTRDNARVASWKDLPAVKAASAAAQSTRRLAPPRLKLTTAAAETAAGAYRTDGKSTVPKKKGKTDASLIKEAKASKTTATAPATAAAASALMQRTPPEPLKNTTTLDIKSNNKQPRAYSVPPAPPTDNTSKTLLSSMLRHQQMTSLGVQTVQLLCIPPSKTQKQSTVVNEHQNQVPTSTEEEARSDEPNAVAVTSPRRQHASTLPSTFGAAPKQLIKVKQRLKGTFYGSAQPPSARQRIRTVDDESDSDLDSFIQTDDDEDDTDSDGGGEDDGEIENQVGINDDERQAGLDPSGIHTTDNHENNHDSQQHTNGIIKLRSNPKPKKWRRELKKALNGYDASKFAEVDAKPDRRMHASYEDILAEEARAGKIGRAIDRIEAEKEAEARAVEKEQRRNERRKLLILEDDDDDDSSNSDDDGANDDVLSESSDDDEGKEDGGVEKHVRKRRKKLAGFLASF